MDSLAWVDRTYVLKHKSDDPTNLRAMYYPNLRMYSTHGQSGGRKPVLEAALAFFLRFGRRAAISLGVYACSFLPVVGRFVLPASSFYTFNEAVGPVPATIIFAIGVLLPRRYLVIFLQSYFASRSLMRQLVSKPIFCPAALLTLRQASALLCTDTLQLRPEKKVFSGSRGRPFRVCNWVLHVSQNSLVRGLDLRRCGSVNSVSDHENN